MLSLFIVDDNKKLRELLEKVVSEYIIEERLEIEVKIVTGNPYEIVDYLEENPDIKGLYILDVDLNLEIDGIELGSHIKQRDPDGRIVIVTGKGNMAFYTFAYKLEVLDYILKGSMDEIFDKVKRCVKIAYERNLKVHSPAEKRLLKIKVGSGMRSIPVEEVCFIEADKQKGLVVHTISGRIEGHGTMQDLEEKSPSFLRTHRTYLVNMDKVVSFDKENRQLEMQNGTHCNISKRKYGAVKKRLGM